MARKKRRFEQLEAAAAAPKEKKTYVDPIQQRVLPRLEGAGSKLEGKGRTILYGIAALVILAILFAVFMRWNNRSGGSAQAALGKAMETSQARVSDTPAPASSTQKTFKTEKERAEAAIAEFQAVIDKFGGDVAEKAKYFIAINRLSTDRPTGVQELETIANSSGETSKLAKFALAQTRVGDNRLDEAATLYQELAAMSDAVIAKETINFELAKIYEKQGKKQEAVELYFSIAKAASEAKDAEGKAVSPSETATEAKAKVKELDPEKAKEIPESAPDSPFGGPIG